MMDSEEIGRKPVQGNHVLREDAIRLTDAATVPATDGGQLPSNDGRRAVNAEGGRHSYAGLIALGAVTVGALGALAGWSRYRSRCEEYFFIEAMETGEDVTAPHGDKLMPDQHQHR